MMLMWLFILILRLILWRICSGIDLVILMVWVIFFRVRRGISCLF